MPHVIEPAATARAKCRGCGEKIAAGELRFGESLPNPFAEGETLHWFHLECGAMKRPESFLEGLAAHPEPVADSEHLSALAKGGVEHPRLPRVTGAERDPSGRAQCRHCREKIEKGAWRIALVFWEARALRRGLLRNDRRGRASQTLLARAHRRRGLGDPDRAPAALAACCRTPCDG
jgi:hypothetical protein